MTISTGPGAEPSNEIRRIIEVENRRSMVKTPKAYYFVSHINVGKVNVNSNEMKGADPTLFGHMKIIGDCHRRFTSAMATPRAMKMQDLSR